MKYYQIALLMLMLINLPACASQPTTPIQPTTTVKPTATPGPSDNPAMIGTQTPSQSSNTPIDNPAGNSAITPDAQQNQPPKSPAELKAFLQQVDQRVYNPITQGLKTLRVVMKDTNATEKFQEFKTMQLVCYWQYPDKRKARFETPDGKVVTNDSLNFFFNDAIDMLGYIVPLPFSQQAVTYQSGVLANPETVQLNISPPAWDVVKEERLFNFSKDYLPVKSSTTHSGMFSHNDQIEYQQKDGKTLLKQITRQSATDMGYATIVIKYRYTNINNYALPDQILIEQNNTSTTFEFEQYRINEKLDANIFQ